MKITCIGGGPAGLYFAVLMKLADPAHEVQVLERNPAGVTHGWGVVFWDDLVAALEQSDPETARHVLGAAYQWHDQEVDVAGQPPVARTGTGYSIARQRLIDILSERARSLGVDVQFGQDVDSSVTVGDADLVVACDGVGSRFRTANAPALGSRAVPGRNKHLWLGTSKVFASFTFAFVETSSGWVWCHAYGYSADRSTFIVECSPETWRGLGLDRMGVTESLPFLEQLFSRQLEGHPLLLQSRPDDVMPWAGFAMLTHESWHRDKVVLMGDAAHTTHFSIGSGTKLALQDAIALASALESGRDIPSALATYEAERRAALLLPQREARHSARWLENVPRYIGLGTEEFADLMHRRRSPILPVVPPALYLKLRGAVDGSHLAHQLWEQVRRIRDGSLRRLAR